MTTSFSNLPSGAQTPDISTLHFEISGLLLGLWASKERKSGLPAAHLLSQDGAAEDGLRAHTDYAACARTGAHTHTHTHICPPAGSALGLSAPHGQHFLQTNKAILDTLCPVSSPGSLRSPAYRPI